MEENNTPSIDDTMSTDMPDDAAILAALSGGEEVSEEIVEEVAEITEEIQEEGTEEVSEAMDFLEEAKKEAELEESKEDTESEEDPETEATEEASEEEPKAAKGDTDMFEVKVNGEIQEVSLQDLKNDYSGRTEVARRYTELDKERKELYTEKSQIEEYVNTFAQKMKSGDAVAALTYLAEFSGTPAYLMKEQLVAAMRPEVERRYNLTQDQQQKELLTDELEYLKAQKESETKRQAQEQSNTELQNSVNSARETHQITEDQWNKAFAALDKEIPSDQDITVEQVTSKSMEFKADDLSTSILSEFNEVPDDAKAALKTVILENPDFTQEDLKEIVKDGLAAAKKQVAEAKALEKAKILKNKVKSTKKSSKSQTTNKNASLVNGLEISPHDDWD